MRKRAFIGSLILVLLCSAAPLSAKGRTHEKGSALRFFYMVGRWVDNFSLEGVDTNYVALPEHSWNAAFTAGSVGLDTRYSRVDPHNTVFTLHARTTPSAELGLNVGYRGVGFSYSWDLLSSYARNMKISFGSKMMGVEFSRQRSSNVVGDIYVNDKPALAPRFEKGQLLITNTNIYAWFALNSAHYSHNAAIKQSYIQRKTAGSLLLHLAYFSSIIQSNDFSPEGGKPNTLMKGYDDVTEMWSQQWVIGLGYGINYTPNKGKVLFHVSANAQLVCYSLNHVSFLLPDTVILPGLPRYLLEPATPVYVTGNMRAAVSWQVNKWVYMSAYASAQNLRFTTSEKNIVDVRLNNWNWNANIVIGVRLGAGRERVDKALAFKELPPKLNNPHRQPDPSRLPKWITDFFFCPR